MFDRIRAWQAEQLEKGEARMEQLRATTARLEEASAVQQAEREAEETARRERAEAVRVMLSERKSERPARAPKPAQGRFRGEDGTLSFDGSSLRYVGHGRRTVPLSEVREAYVESGEAFRQRVSLGRTGIGALAGGMFFGPVGLLAGMGFGAAATKKAGGEKYLGVRTTRQAFVVEVPPKRIAEAHTFVMELESAIASPTTRKD